MPSPTPRSPRPGIFRWFPDAPPDVLNKVVANSWPLPYSCESSSVLSFGLASAALSFFNCQTLATRFAVAMSVCLPLPKPIRTSCSLVVDTALLFRFLCGRVALAPARDHQRHDHVGHGLELARLGVPVVGPHPDFVCYVS